MTPRHLLLLATLAAILVAGLAILPARWSS